MTNPTHTLDLINARIARGMAYGADMATSKAVCLDDAASMLSDLIRELGDPARPTTARTLDWHAIVSYDEAIRMASTNAPAFDNARDYLDSLTAAQCDTRAHGAWMANDREANVIYRSAAKHKRRLQLSTRERLACHAKKTDSIFDAELRRQFGRDACNRRYDAKLTGWDNMTKAAGNLKLIADARRRLASRKEA